LKLNDSFHGSDIPSRKLKMKIAIVGGGPSGLYFGLLVKKRMPEASITVFEQNRANDTFGFGVVMADTGLSHLEAADKPTHDALAAAMRFSHKQLIKLDDQELAIEKPGAGGGAIPRLVLLDILQKHGADAGMDLRFSTRYDLSEPSFKQALEDADLVVGADGVNSVIRQQQASAFGTTHRLLTNRFAWFGTEKVFECPALVFKHVDGGRFIAHYYPYSDTMSTFVAECDEATWVSCGLADMTDEQRQAKFESVFAAELENMPLISSNSVWRQFPVVRNEHWSVGKTVLLGDALSSAHFSIGSGTRIAMEDSIALAEAVLALPEDIPAALASYELNRRPSKTKLIAASENSFNWYENIQEPMSTGNVLAFVKSFMTRTGRIDEERLRKQFPELVAALEAQKRQAELELVK
jgi:2-polyprenyl-6-methoxyphenol hydroxylase-like FAD-dependent oxidoreductase